MKYRIIFSLFSVVIFLCSCCYKGKYSAAGYPRKAIKSFENKNVGVFNIDTLAVYKWEVSYGTNSSKEYTYYEKQLNRNYPSTAYLKFYPNNKLGIFVIRKSDTLNLTREHFNPKNARMGYYYFNGNNIVTKVSTIQQCELAITKVNGKIIGDTIIEENNLSGTIYVKKNISKEYLENWKPDW